MKQYIQNISKGKEIIEFYIDELKKDGITNLPRWIPHGGDQKWLVHFKNTHIYFRTVYYVINCQTHIF